MAATTRRGVWELQQVRDQYLNGELEKSNMILKQANSQVGNMKVIGRNQKRKILLARSTT